jgi:PKD repeat protein
MGAGLLILTLVLSALGLAQPVAPKGIIIKPPDESPFSVSVWMEKGAYSVGENVVIHYSVSRAAYIYIFDIDVDGIVRTLLPSYYYPNNYVNSGEHQLPDGSGPAFTVILPTGTEYLQIFASSQPWEVVPEFKSSDPFPLIANNPDAFKNQLQVQVLGLVPTASWASNWTSFQVVSGTPPAYKTLTINATVNSAPIAAAITLDGTFIGYTPRTVYVAVGTHQVTLSKASYQTWTQNVTVLANTTLNVNLVPTGPANQPPVAAFTTTPPNPLVGSPVLFNGSGSYDPDGMIVSFSWSFGDGAIGAGPTASHAYGAAGTYPVTLTVTDNRGATDSETRSISVGPVNQPPTASFMVTPPNPAVGAWVQFNGTASSDPDGFITTYSWNYGDGTPPESGNVRFHQYAAAGLYTVTLTVTDNGGATDTETYALQVGSANLPPTAVASASPNPTTVLQWIRFDGTASSDPDGTVAAYSWNFGDGSPAESGSVRFHQYTAPGSYLATLTVTDNAGATNTGTLSVLVSTTNQPPVAVFGYTPPSPGIGELVTLNGSGSYDPDGTVVSYQWDLDGNGTTDAVGPVTTVRFYSPGLRPVRLTVTDNGGLSNSVTQGVAVATSGGTPGTPAMGGTPGIFVWGTDTWHVTVNAGASWTSPHAYRIELRTDGSFQNVNQSTSGGVVPLGIIPTPTDFGKTLLFEGSLSVGSIDFSFKVPASQSVWMSLKLDTDGNGTVEEARTFVYLRNFMVNPPYAPFVVGLPTGSGGPLVPSLNFRIGQPIVYNTAIRIVNWTTRIENLEP